MTDGQTDAVRIMFVPAWQDNSEQGVDGIRKGACIKVIFHDVSTHSSRMKSEIQKGSIVISFFCHGAVEIFWFDAQYRRDQKGASGRVSQRAQPISVPILGTIG